PVYGVRIFLKTKRVRRHRGRRADSQRRFSFPIRLHHERSEWPLTREHSSEGVEVGQLLHLLTGERLGETLEFFGVRDTEPEENHVTDVAEHCFEKILLPMS